MSEQTIPDGPQKLIAQCASDWDIPAARLRAAINGSPDRARDFIIAAEAIDTLFRNDAASADWFHEPARMLDGECPIDIMRRENGLARIRQYAEYLAGR